MTETGTDRGTPFSLPGTVATSYTVNESGNPVDGSLSLSESGADRYAFLEQSDNTSNAVSGNGPGNVDYSAVGAPLAIVQGPAAPTGGGARPGEQSPAAQVQDPFAQQGLDLLHEYCWKAGTGVIDMSGAEHPIESIHAGLSLVTVSDRCAEGPLGENPVEQRYDNRPANVIDLYVDGQLLHPTRNHPIYVRGKGWVSAANLVIGDELRSVELPSGECGWRRVTGLKDNGEVVPVFNLRVALHHTYFVGKREWGFGFLAHNQSKTGGEAWMGQNGPVYTPEEIAQFETRIYMDGKTPSMWGALAIPGGESLFVTGQHLPEQRMQTPGMPAGATPMPGPKQIALTAVEANRKSISDTFIGLYNPGSGMVTRNGESRSLKYVLDLATGQNGYRQPTADYWDSVFRPFEEVDVMNGDISYDSTPTGGGSGQFGEAKRMVQPLLCAMAVRVITDAAIQYIGGPLAGKAVGFALSKAGGALSVVFKKEGKYFAKELTEVETARVIKSLKNAAAGGSDEAAQALNQWAKSEGKAATQAAKALDDIAPSNFAGAPLESRFRANMKATNTAGMKTGTKGLLGETRTAIAMRRAGFEELPARLPSNNGFDGVWIKRGADGQVSEIFITESKFASDGAMRLADTKTMGKQLSQTWIDGNIQKMLNSDNPAVVRAAQLLDANKALIKPKVAVLDSDGILRFYDP